MLRSARFLTTELKSSSMVFFRIIYIDRSKNFRPLYGALRELRSFVPSCAPMLATTATVTSLMRENIIRKLDIDGCCLVSESPDKPNITYEVVRKNTIEEDFSLVVRNLAECNIKARRVVVYCQSIVTCAMFLILFINKTLTRQTGYELAYGADLQAKYTITCFSGNGQRMRTNIVAIATRPSFFFN